MVWIGLNMDGGRRQGLGENKSVRDRNLLYFWERKGEVLDKIEL